MRLVLPLIVVIAGSILSMASAIDEPSKTAGTPSVKPLDPATDPTAKPNARDQKLPIKITPADETLARKLRKEIEALPEETRMAGAIEIMKSSLDKIESIELKRKFLISIGKLHQELGHAEEAQASFEAAAGLEPIAVSEFTALKNLLIDAFSDGDRQEAVAVAVRALQREGEGSLTGVERLEITYFLAKLEVVCGKPQEAMKRFRTLVEKSIDPAVDENEYFIRSESLAGSLAVNDEKQQALEQMIWTRETFPKQSNTPRFYNNLAHRTEVAGKLNESLALRKELIEKFPESVGIPDQLAIIASHYRESGNDEMADNYYRQVLNHPKSSDELRKIASESLGDSAGAKKPSDNPL